MPWNSAAPRQRPPHGGPDGAGRCGTERGGERRSSPASSRASAADNSRVAARSRRGAAPSPAGRRPGTCAAPAGFALVDLSSTTLVSLGHRRASRAPVTSAVGQDQPAPQTLELLLRDARLGRDAVALDQAEGRIRHALAEVGVVGQEQRPLVSRSRRPTGRPRPGRRPGARRLCAGRADRRRSSGSPWACPARGRAPPRRAPDDRRGRPRPPPGRARPAARARPGR